MNNPSQHSPETIARMKANAEAAKKRLAHLNNEYMIRRQAEKQSRSRVKTNDESFGEAIARVAKDAQIAL